MDEKTVSVLCHQIRHWFGATGIIDPDFPERPVTNYRDERSGMDKGRIVWDEAEAVEQGFRGGNQVWCPRNSRGM